MKPKPILTLAVLTKSSVQFLFGFYTILFATSASVAAESEAFTQYQIDEVATGLAFPWSIAFLDDNKILLSERQGNLRIIDKGKVSEPLSGLPDDVFVKGQGGLQDLVLHPNFARNGWIYLSYAAGNDDRNHLKVIRFRLADSQLTDIQKIYQVSPGKSTPVHYGARMAFMSDATLLITSGDGFDYREHAQKLDSELGKVLRVNADGSLPKNNPYIGETEKNVSKAIFSYGHRNPQGLVYDPIRKLIYLNEHGPAGGDEINVIHPGHNYGWPVITNGRDYSGASISPFKEYPGMQQPFVDWTPSIAPSGMAVYYGKMFPELQGGLLVSTLKSREVVWVQMKGLRTIGQVSLFADLGYRFRDVRVHNDGSIYLLTDSEQGKILRVSR